MNTIVKSAGAVAIAVAVALVGVAPASAAPPSWYPQPYGGPYHHHRVHVRPPVYYNYGYPQPSYYPGYYYYDPGPAIAASFIGGIFGTIAAEAIHHRRIHHR